MLTFYGRPGDQVALIASKVAAFSDRPDWRGVLLAGGPGLRFERIGRMPPSGFLSVSRTIAALPPGVEGDRVFLQALFTNTSGQLFLGARVTQAIPDLAFSF